MGQGARLTPEQIQRVADALEISPSWRAAADHAGVNERTVHRYRERADAYANRHNQDDNLPNLPDETDPDFECWQIVQGWLEARSHLEMTLVLGILGAIPKDWKAAHAMLKSGWPQDYSDRVELTGAGGGPIQVDNDAIWARGEALLAEIEAKRARELTAQSDESAEGPRAGNPE